MGYQICHCEEMRSIDEAIHESSANLPLRHCEACAVKNNKKLVILSETKCSEVSKSLDFQSQENVML